MSKSERIWEILAGCSGDPGADHDNHFVRLKDFLLPVLDQTYSALILDLEARGLLDETLVLCLSEHGRTPRLSKANGGGRDHWSRAYCQVFAGGGMGRGNLVGRTDAIAGDVQDTPLSPKDVLATAVPSLGDRPAHDRAGPARPLDAGRRRRRRATRVAGLTTGSPRRPAPVGTEIDQLRQLAKVGQFDAWLP